MTKREIEERIEKLEDSRFYLSMKDFWDRRDYQRDNELCNEIRKLREELKNF